MPSFEELKKLRKPIENINVKHKESLTRLERFAVLITDHIGTAGFFVIISIWTVVWIFWNTFGPREARFDPFPAFVLWIFVSNIIAGITFGLTGILMLYLTLTGRLGMPEPTKLNLALNRFTQNQWLNLVFVIVGLYLLYKFIKRGLK